LGACRNLIFGVFVLYLARFLFQSSFYSKSRMCTRPLFSHFVTKLDRLAGQPIQILFAIQIFFGLIQIYYEFLRGVNPVGDDCMMTKDCIHIQIMNTNSQAQGDCTGHAGGTPNYKNNIIINIVERVLPHGLEAWRQVAAEYQRESSKTTLCRGEGLRENWNKKLCNHMQKPTGKPGAFQDRIFRCIDIKHRI
jgi:hypothetical protein